jgi:pimeloyl-ACP methyl ester carboxylesterase
MNKIVRCFFLALISIQSATAQNVMSHLDGLYQYDANAPVGSLNNPAIPPTNTLSKWVHDPSLKINYYNGYVRILWNQSRYKSYIFRGMAYRLRFPQNYDPSGNTKYPLILFMHGGGEAAFVGTYEGPGTTICLDVPINRENQDQLYWNGEIFDKWINDGLYNAFVMFPQQGCTQRSGWDISMYEPINAVLDTLQKYNNFDPARLIVTGLSNGGAGALNYAKLYPKRTAICIPAVPAGGFGDPTNMIHIPSWITFAWDDPRPKPGDVTNYIDDLRDAGGNVYDTYYPTKNHICFDDWFAMRFSNNKLMHTEYWNRAHKAQPVVLYEKTQFCADEPIAAKIGLSPGFYAYEWQKNNAGTFENIAGAAGNEYTARAPGQYRVRFKATATEAWSAWSPSPISISIKPCNSDTVFRENFEFYGSQGYLSTGPSQGYKSYNHIRQGGLFRTGTEKFTYDATGNEGRRFLLNHTLPQIEGDANPQFSTPYAVGDIVWRYDGVTVTPNTDYIFSFYVGNITSIIGSPLVQIVPAINSDNLNPINITPSGVGDSSWTRYQYIWNSGSNTSIFLELKNNSIEKRTGPRFENGNDFVIDEISLTKATAPGGVAAKLVTWTKSENLSGSVVGGISRWPNTAGSKDLVQPVYNNKPGIASNAAAEWINFNPVAAFNTVSAKSLTAKTGFSGNTSHNSAYIYMVARTNNTSTTNNVILENLGGANNSKISIELPNNGSIKWTAGNPNTSLVQTPFTATDVNKPILWSFTKNDAGTPSAAANKQDIRKNGLVINSATTTTGNFQGNNSNMVMGNFDGKVAEFIYYLDGALNAADQNKIESYLAIKYGLTLGGTGGANPPQNYTASNGTVIWNGSILYQNDVFGIGRDNNSGLKQSISNSMNTGNGDGSGQRSKGNLVVQTSGTLSDLQFMVMGHNGGLLAEQTIELPATSSGAKRIGREWKVINTGNTGAVNISFNRLGLTYSGGNTLVNYALLIDNSGNGDFTVANLTAKIANSIDGPIVNFNNVTLPNNAVFTIATFAPTGASLPATWLGFVAEWENNITQLKWETTDEWNVRDYLVEFSENSIDYTTIETVPAKNLTGNNVYQLQHNIAIPGIYYYRIRRTDNDGKTGYSAVRIVKVSGGKSKLQLLSNPVTGNLLPATIQSEQNTSAVVRLVNIEGKALLVQNIKLKTGLNQLNLNIANLADGLYLIEVNFNNNKVVEKFIKARQ